MSDFRFESSYVLSFLWLLPVLYFVSKFYAKRVEKHLSKNLSAKLRPLLTSSVSLSKREWKFRLSLIVLMFLILAYARPQNGEGRQKVKNEGIEILFLVDVSNSMMAEDIKPSRIELAKNEINRFIDLSSGDRMGIVAFAGSAVLLSPMTTDQDAIKMYVDSLSPEVISTQGTDFTRALKEAKEAFSRGGLGEQEDTQVTRAIVVVSDGEDQEPGAYEEAKILSKEGIHIFTLGVGTEQGGAIPIRDNQGVLRGYKRGKDNQVIMSKTKGTVLKELARIGEGAFHHATFQSDAVKAIRSDIEKLKKSQFESGEIRSYSEEFQIFLILALLVAIFEIWLGERKEVGRIWRGRFEVAGD
ncbi:MAG: VWA domain-containing protein [Bdellovibrionales bacterium]|nr:VWA domain-containing protein [Bdellovibrionales bacterium]